MTRRELLMAAGAAPAWAAKSTPIGDDIFFAPVSEVSRRLRAKEFSCVELTRAFCDRLEKFGPRYNALALSLRQSAVQLAKDVDDEIKLGRFRGPLHGIPYAAKDLLALEGSVTAWGAKPYAAQVLDETSTVLKKLASVKAPLLAKLAMVELAGGPNYSAPAASFHGPARNPWDPTRWAGGSSSGSGAAMAAGLAPFTLGSETSGSILTPAAYCGITGLRPTFGLVSRFGAMSLSTALDKIGPMCRTAEDCGHVLAAIAGGDDKDPYSAGKPFHFAPQFARPLGEIRVGFAPVDFEVWASEEIRPALRQALDVVKSLGVQMKEARIPDLPYGPTVGTIIMAEGSHSFRSLIETGKVDELADARQIQGLKDGLKVTASDYLKALERQREIKDAFAKFFYEECDVVLAPARLTVADPADQPFVRRDPNARPPSPDRGNTAIIPAGNLAGLPAISLPCGFAGALPVGIQLVARQNNENLLLKLGMEFQKRTDWHTRRPKVE